MIATEHARTQAAFDGLPVAVGILDSNLRIIWANERLQPHVPSLLSVECDLPQAVQEAHVSGGPAVIRLGSTSDGVRLHVSPSSAVHGEIVILGEGQEPGSIPSSADDLNALEYCDVPVIVYDPEGAILGANEKASQFTGYEHEALLSSRISELTPQDNAYLMSTGDHMVTIQPPVGPGVRVRIRVKSIEHLGKPAFAVTIFTTDARTDARAENVAVLEGCLMGAFPDSVITSGPLEPSRRAFYVSAITQKRLLVVTDAALDSEDFRRYLREIPEALNLTRSVLMTEEGVKVAD